MWQQSVFSMMRPSETLLWTITTDLQDITAQSDDEDCKWWQRWMVEDLQIFSSDLSAYLGKRGFTGKWANLVFQAKCCYCCFASNWSIFWYILWHIFWSSNRAPSNNAPNDTAYPIHYVIVRSFYSSAKPIFIYIYNIYICSYPKCLITFEMHETIWPWKVSCSSQWGARGCLCPYRSWALEATLRQKRQRHPGTEWSSSFLFMGMYQRNSLGSVHMHFDTSEYFCV